MTVLSQISLRTVDQTDCFGCEIVTTNAVTQLFICHLIQTVQEIIGHHFN